MYLPDLRTIAENATKDAYSIERIHWHKGVDRACHFFPESLTPLFHCSSYRTVLDADDRRLYNQLFAQFINEQFIFLEDRFLCRFVERLLPWSASVSVELKQCLVRFLEDEVKHTEMFRRLNKMTDANRYGYSDHYFMRMGKLENKLFNLMSKYPCSLNFWIWIALLFEEKTVNYHTHYQLQQQDEKQSRLDSLYFQVHQFHMLDESRHVQIDEHLLRYIFDQSSFLSRNINISLFKKAFHNYVSPHRANNVIVAELCQSRHHLRHQVERLSAELRAQDGHSSYQMAQFSRRNFPKTFSCFDSYADVSTAMRKVIHTYSPVSDNAPALG